MNVNKVNWRYLLCLCLLGAVLLFAGCKDDTGAEADCEESTFSCAGNMLMACKEGQWTQFTDCSFDKKECAIMDGEPKCATPAGVSDADTDTDSDTDADTGTEPQMDAGAPDAGS